MPDRRPESRANPAAHLERAGTFPEVIAHRGANREAPENTLPAFEAAVRLGADGIELDIQMTADGMPVVHHDARLPDRAGPGLQISALTHSEVTRLSALPTLGEVIESVGRRCRLYVEIKAPDAIEAVLTLLRPLGESCAVHAFDHRVIARARVLAPAIPRGILLVSHLLDAAAVMRAVGARDLWQHVDMVDRELIDGVHSGGGRVICWTANDPSRARRLISMGVDGLCTDTPRELRQVVDASQC